MLVRIAKKDDLTGKKALLIRIAAILFALVMSGLLVWAMGHNPLETAKAMVQGSFGSKYGIKNTINIAVPYLITALAISIAFSMKFWNIGGEGQIVMGAVFATEVTRLMPENTNGFVLIMTMGLAGMLGGALWALIPALFKAVSNTNETLFTLMMNYIAIKITLYLRAVLWKDPEGMGFPKIAPIPLQSHLPKLFGVNIGWLIALVLTALVFIFMKYTKKGYEILVVGESEKTAHYAGINVKKVLITGVIISGALAGFAGMVKLTGVAFTLSESIGGGDGFTGIIIAWLSNLSGPVMIIVSVLFAAMKQGALAIEAKLAIPSSVADIIQGMILFCALGSEFFIRYKLVLDRGMKKMIHNSKKSELEIEGSDRV